MVSMNQIRPKTLLGGLVQAFAWVDDEDQKPTKEVKVRLSWRGVLLSMPFALLGAYLFFRFFGG